MKMRFGSQGVLCRNCHIFCSSSGCVCTVWSLPCQTSVRSCWAHPGPSEAAQPYVHRARELLPAALCKMQPLKREPSLLPPCRDV